MNECNDKSLHFLSTTNSNDVIFESDSSEDAKLLDARFIYFFYC